MLEDENKLLCENIEKLKKKFLKSCNSENQESSRSSCGSTNKSTFLRENLEAVSLFVYFNF